MRFMITGTAGFIGFHLARRLIANGDEVTGVDGMTDYYDVGLKRARHAILKGHNGFAERLLMLEDANGLAQVAQEARPDVIVHLAAQAGVRYSIDNPRSYIDANLVGTFNVLEAARRHEVKHLLLASTSSVYGGNQKVPFREVDAADYPLSLYAATKKATEAMSHSYAHLWNIPTTAFRFFTVYGPWGRPDMAYFKFAQAILQGCPIQVYNYGDMERDFTYVDDLIESIVRLADHPPAIGAAVGEFDSLSPVAPWRTVNIGRGAPVNLMDFIGELENALGRIATKELLPMQPGDSAITFADSSLLEAIVGYRPSTNLQEGVGHFCAWYREHSAETASLSARPPSHEPGATGGCDSLAP